MRFIGRSSEQHDRHRRLQEEAPHSGGRSHHLQPQGTGETVRDLGPEEETVLHTRAHRVPAQAEGRKADHRRRREEGRIVERRG